MIYFRDTTDFYMAGPTAVTLGKFDGLHLGHQKLLRQILEVSRGRTSSVVFTLNPRQEALLLTDQEQKEILDRMGVDCMIKCPFVPEISGMSPREFIEKVLIGSLHAACVVVGTDFRFGYKRAGDAAFLKACEAKYGLKVYVIEKEKYKGREISSTYVREALAEGDIPLVNTLMGRPYTLEGTVIHGRHLGTKLGMPTANIVPDPAKLLPPNGVYYSMTSLEEEDAQGHKTVTEGQSIWHPGLTNIGIKPTVGSRYVGAETYLYDGNQELYSRQIRVRLLHYERPEVKFASIDELKLQIERDVSRGREYFREYWDLEA